MCKPQPVYMFHFKVTIKYMYFFPVIYQPCIISAYKLQDLVLAKHV